MTTSDDEAVCKTCSQTRAWHQEHHPRHQFNPGDVSFKEQFGQSAKQRKEDAEAKPQAPASYPIDPVLRQALVDAGVITPEQLDAARRKIEDMTKLFGGGFVG